MSAIFLPRKWRHQPAGPVEVDADALNAFSICGGWVQTTEPVRRDLFGAPISFDALDPSVVDLTRIPSPFGTAGVYDKPGGSERTIACRTGSPGGRSFTFLCRIKLNVAPGLSRVLCRTGVEEVPNGDTILLWRPSGQWDMRVAGTNYAQAGSWELGRWYDVEIVGGEGSCELFVDGATVISGSRGGSSAIEEWCGLGGVGGGGMSSLGFEISYLLWANRPLDATARSELRASPWQLFRAPSHRIWFDVGGGAPAAIEGDVVAEESGADTLAATGSVVVAGSFAAAEAGADTFAATGGAVATGTLAASETGVDTLAFAGEVLVAGSLAATETGADTVAATGKVLVVGTLNAAETGADTASVTGSVLVAGTLSAAEAGTDTFSASGAGQAAGTLAAVESGTDTITAAGQIVVSGALSASEAGSDTWAATGAVRISGSFSASESGTDTFSSTGEQPAVTGDLAASEIGTDGFAAVGIVPAIGSFDLLEAGHDSLTGAGQIIVAGMLGAVESGEDSFYAAPAGSISGLMAAVEAADSFSARGHGRSAHGVRMGADRGYQSMTMGRPAQRVTTRRPRQRG